jgi:hypothetical protein
MALYPSKRQAALQDLIARLAYITKEKGYNTDAGEHIFLGEAPTFGEDDPPEALAVLVGEDSPQTSGGLIRTRTPIEIWAVVPATLEQPLLAVEAIIADIKEAVEIEADGSVDRFLGMLTEEEGKPYGTLPKGLERGSIRALRRQEGSTYVGASVEYVAHFEEAWGGGGS